VLAQSYVDYELIVVDDASTDDTGKQVDSFHDPRIRYARHPKRRGGSAARNTGIELARAELIAFLDSDDEWLPDKLRHQLGVFRCAGGDVGLVYSDFLRVHPDGREVRHRPVARGISIGYPSRWLVRRDVFAEIGGFDETMPAMQDTEISIRIQKAFRLHHDPVVVMKYHVTGKSVSRSAGNVLLAADALIGQYAHMVTKDELAHWYALLGKACMVEGDVARARRSLLRAATLRPLKPRHYGALLASLLGPTAYLYLRRRKHRSAQKDAL
jgi:glycosyltransferase involved in cell wall biosynthesis